MLASLITAFRPHQWIKNGVVLAGLIFSRNAADPRALIQALVAFVVFCAVSSASYLINDVVDLERDRQHPKKRCRPVASGDLPVPLAIGVAIILFLVSFWVAQRLAAGFAAAVVSYTVLILAYSLVLKGMVILDIMVIAIGFVIRAIAGVEVLRDIDPSTEISPWLLVCTLFLALFLAAGKRRQELGLLEDEAREHRRTLSQYSKELLDHIMAVLTAATLIAYATYTIAPGTVARIHTPGLVYTVPFVVYGIFRYLYLVVERRGGGNPAEVLVKDTPLLVNTLLWLGTVAVVLYAH